MSNWESNRRAQRGQEDGLGWSGVAPSAADRRTEQAEASRRAHIAKLQRTADAYKWAYEYLQSRMESIGRESWAHDCDSEIDARINRKG